MTELQDAVWLRRFLHHAEEADLWTPEGRTQFDQALRKELEPMRNNDQLVHYENLFRIARRVLYVEVDHLIVLKLGPIMGKFTGGEVDRV